MDIFSKLMVRKIKIIDVILHKNQYSTQTFIIVNRMPEFVYEKDGRWLIGEDSGFYNFFCHERASKNWQAFAGRKFKIPLKNGDVIEATGQWWDGVPEKYRHLSQYGANTKEKLCSCNVYTSINLDEQLVDDWLAKNTPSNNYNKYSKRSKDYMVQNIISRFENTCSGILKS